MLKQQKKMERSKQKYAQYVKNQEEDEDSRYYSEDDEDPLHSDEILPAGFEHCQLRFNKFIRDVKSLTCD